MEDDGAFYLETEEGPGYYLVRVIREVGWVPREGHLGAAIRDAQAVETALPLRPR